MRHSNAVAALLLDIWRFMAIHMDAEADGCSYDLFRKLYHRQPKMARCSCEVVVEVEGGMGYEVGIALCLFDS